MFMGHHIIYVIYYIFFISKNIYIIKYLIWINFSLYDNNGGEWKNVDEERKK